MSDDICPHCGHAWDLHLTRCLGPTGIHCGCQWTKPKPPPKPKTDHELFVDQVAGTIFSAVREHCDGYTDEYGCVDGEVDFSAVADAVIRELNLKRVEMCEWDVLAQGFRGFRYVTPWDVDDDQCGDCGRCGDERDGCNCVYPKGHPSRD